MTPRLASFAGISLLVSVAGFHAACGGNVVVDQPSTVSGTGGATSSTGTVTFTSTTTTGTSTSSTTGSFTSTSTSSTTGTFTTGTGTTTGVCGGSVLSQDFTCESCVEQSCCAELSACSPGTACGQLLGCRGSCSDDGCLQKCEAVFAAGQAQLGALDMCYQGNCSNDCFTPICDSGASTTTIQCGNCLGANCCSPITACIGDTTCLDCLSMDPSTPECQADALVAATLGCIQNSCALSCQ
jgi:hypothetical protein